MKLKTLIFLFFLTIISCVGNKDKDKEMELSLEGIEILDPKAPEPENEIFANIGPIISIISFELKANQEQKKNFENGFIPWVSIQDYQKEIDQLHNADEIVIPENEATLIIDYPVNNPTSFTLKTTEKGFSRKVLISEINKKYLELYEEEEKTAKTKTIPKEQRKGLINRNQTDGKYGIWGHDLGDLVLSSVEVYKDKAGKITIVLGIES